jgi:hypothetical protein
MRPDDYASWVWKRSIGGDLMHAGTRISTQRSGIYNWRRNMFSHMMVGSNDIALKTFYDAAFAAMGGKPGIQDPKGRLILYA